VGVIRDKREQTIFLFPKQRCPDCLEESMECSEIDADRSGRKSSRTVAKLEPQIPTAVRFRPQRRADVKAAAPERRVGENIKVRAMKDRSGKTAFGQSNGSFIARTVRVEAGRLSLGEGIFDLAASRSGRPR